MAIELVQPLGNTVPPFAHSPESPINPAERCSSLTLAAESLQASPAFHPAELSPSSRHIGVAMGRLQRCIVVDETTLQEQLGEHDREVVAQAQTFIQDGTLPYACCYLDFFDPLKRVNAADTAQTVQSRTSSVLEVGLAVLAGSRGTGLNLLNVAARTGLVVTLTTVLRQMVSFYVEQALQARSPTEASRAWAVVAVTMIGPALSLMGAIRDECAGMASLQSRLGRACMASITLGSLIAATVTGASSSLLSGVVSTNVYTLARDVTNAFFPLQDNAAGATAKATGVTTVSYGAVQYLLAEVAALMPLSGAARVAAGFDYALSADVIQAGLNAAGAVIDDFIAILCRNRPLLSPTVGPELVFSDLPLSVSSDLHVRVVVRSPSWEQMGNAVLNVNASRTSAFQAINLVLGTVALDMTLADHDQDAQGRVLNLCLMLMLMTIYFPFVWSCSQRTDTRWSPEQRRETPVP